MLVISCIIKLVKLEGRHFYNPMPMVSNYEALYNAAINYTLYRVKLCIPLVRTSALKVHDHIWTVIVYVSRNFVGVLEKNHHIVIANITMKLFFRTHPKGIHDTIVYVTNIWTSI